MESSSGRSEAESGRRNGNAAAAPSSTNMLLEMEDFTDLKQIGKGKDCVVYAAKCTKLGNSPVVLKVYDKSVISAVKQRSIRREARIMRYLTETRVPHVTKYIGAFQNSASIYIVMEQCGGGDLLEQLLKEGRAMTEKRVVREVVLPILTGLAYMHAAGIIHRDIKLENLFISSAGHLQLGDFGLALCVHEEKAISPVGTLEYMPPEILRLPTTDLVLKGTVKVDDITPVDEKVDIWSFGVTVYELVTGRSPFEGAGKDEIRANILKFAMRPLPSFLTNDCKDFIHKCLTPDAAGRPGAMELLHHTWPQRHLGSVDRTRLLALPAALPKLGMGCTAPAPKLATQAEAAAAGTTCAAVAAAAGGVAGPGMQPQTAVPAAAAAAAAAAASIAAAAMAGTIPAVKAKDPVLQQGDSPHGQQNGIKAFIPAASNSSTSTTSTTHGIAGDISASTSRESQSSRGSGSSGASVADSAASLSASGIRPKPGSPVSPAAPYAAPVPAPAMSPASQGGWAGQEPIQEEEEQSATGGRHPGVKKKKSFLSKFRCMVPTSASSQHMAV